MQWSPPTTVVTRIALVGVQRAEHQRVLEIPEHLAFYHKFLDL